MSAPYIGTYEWIGMRPTRKQARHLKRRMLKHQPFLYMVDIYLFRNTRRVRRIIAALRRGTA